MIDEKKLIKELEKIYETDEENIDCTLSDFAYHVFDCIKQQPKVGEWIPVSERLPDDRDNRFYMCTVENHEEDPPMFCQYEEEYGFGFWHDIYNGETLGFVDSEFKTTEELGYEKVIAWQPLPEPYKESRR